MTESSDYHTRFSGIERLYGKDGAHRIRKAHVCVVGIGGVGSWAAEALVRSGIGALTLIDFDEVCFSNVNRQLPALTETVGRPKVRVMTERAARINPECNLNAVEEFFTPATAERLVTPAYDYLLDAIDNVSNKCLLLARCRDLRIPVITVGGAGGRRDPTAVKIADLAFTSHDPLLQRVRKILRTDFRFPQSSQEPFGIDCVFSHEAPVYPQPDGTICATPSHSSDLRLNCDSGYGTATFITGTFGFIAAAQLVRRLVQHLPR